MYAIGLMSGTSLDGIDAVLCNIEGTDLNTKVKEIAFDTYRMPGDIKQKIKLCCQNEASTALICSLNFELGELFGKAALSIASKGHIAMRDISFIASHGQTVYHIPFKTEHFLPSTLQIGESAVIAKMCECPVISNFRSMDMAVGGQGAPLVPFSEYVLYAQKEKSVVLQNIGGIGNVTVIPKSCNIDDVFAFDTGPGNMMIDEAMFHLYHKSYDKDGETALSGHLIEALKEELLHHDYLKRKPPKSTGRELFGKEYTMTILNKYHHEKPEDIIHTLTWFTAYSIAFSYQNYIEPVVKINESYLGGGGAHNKTLQMMLQDMLPHIAVKTQEDIGFSSDSKEAVAFVIMGNQTINHLPSNVCSATGAARRVILGDITFPR